MKKVGIIHSVKVVADFFEKEVHKHIDNIMVYNLLDDYLSKDLQEKGRLTKETTMRFITLIREIHLVNVDAIVCTCSSLSIIVPQIRPLFNTPIITIDEMMLKEAAKKDGRLLIVATSSTAIQPVINGIQKQLLATKKDVQIKTLYCEEAGIIMRSAGDMSRHDMLIINKIKELAQDFDSIVLAQASISRIKDQIINETGLEVLSGPQYCVEELKDILGSAEQSRFS